MIPFPWRTSFLVDPFASFTLAILLLFVGIGFIVLPVLGVMWLVFVVLATLKAKDGYAYRYPLTIRFVS